MPISKAQQKSVDKYKNANYDRIVIHVPKGRKEDLKAYCDRLNTTSNALINELLRHELGLSHDSWKEKPSIPTAAIIVEEIASTGKMLTDENEL